MELDTVRYSVVRQGESRSFPEGDAVLKGVASSDDAEVMIYCGVEPQFNLKKTAILIELGTECLDEHLDDESAITNVLGFARFRNGKDAPSMLVELVRRRQTSDSAISAARSVFEAAGLSVTITADQPGRILDRLIRPKYNAAPRFLDEGLATQSDVDLTCKLGLGYPDGPIERVLRGGLDHHFDVTKALFDTFGTPSYAPPRRAIAAARARRVKGS
jgi:3-hydroxybutyryl-CoA dehydrogenase